MPGIQVEEGRRRVIIEGVTPEIDCGRSAVKRIVGDSVVVEADIFGDGHDLVSAVLLSRYEKQQEWTETPMTFLVNDRWRADFITWQIGKYYYTIQAWVDRFATWQHDIRKKIDAGQDVAVDLLIGAKLVEEAAGRADGGDQSELQKFAAFLRDDHDLHQKLELIINPELLRRMEKHADRRFQTTYRQELQVVVDREKAAFSAWYELFPRSTAAAPGAHGTFRDCEARLPYVAYMGFDVLYLPPIHPVGKSFRKGKNNNPEAQPNEPGSPWGIGSEQGGHKAIHAELGTLEDFRRLVKRAAEFGIEIALDIAFQASPDHPWAREHPEWFRKRPDGTIQYAENPPKKYQDIYPIDFESEAWRELWLELKSVFDYWIEQGVRIFRVDNPHTKAFAFWEWAIGRIKDEHPDVLFLSEAFTRPKIMYRLAKLGFTQSYTYFAWRNSKWELTEYFTELTQTQVAEFFRPNLWPNTPDILTAGLQYGGRPAFMTRLILAATLGANYGIYGPAFELGEHMAREPGSEEYLNSEKYEIRHWDLGRPDSLKDLIARVNRIRRENVALQRDSSLRFHFTDNDNLLCYSKRADSNVILVVVNLDPYHTHTGWTGLTMDQLGLHPDQGFQVHDLLTDARYWWTGARNYIELNPFRAPAHIFRIEY